MNALATIAETGAKPIVKAELKKPVTGYEAQGFAIAMRVLSISRTAARDLHRCVVSLYALDADARNSAAKHLGTRREAITELVAQGVYSEKEAKKLMASATVYCSQMRTIIKAINAGMTQETVLLSLVPEDKRVGAVFAPDAFDAVGFAVIYKTATAFLGTQAKPRVSLVFADKLRKFLETNSPDETDTAGLVMYNAAVALCNGTATREAAPF
jgi:uncharacterized membrane protein YqgA involved in biofilm formation